MIRKPKNDWWLKEASEPPSEPADVKEPQEVCLHCDEWDYDIYGDEDCMFCDGTGLIPRKSSKSQKCGE